MNHDTDPIRTPSVVAQQIPCFQGYRETLHRRESDRRVRDKLCDLLVASKRIVDRHLARQVDQGILNCLAAGERLKSRIDQLLQTIQSNCDAPFFDSRECSDRLLSEIDAIESSLIMTSISIGEIATALPKHDTSSLETIGRLNDAVNDLTQLFAERSQRIQSVAI
ncbi:hypothetical protein Poly24_20170 [Rosistilla carotiformis]|uniref:Uncharacterized protein n=1 Tax=Rosistilla carotiformis TaxID=2528017 RepID=A0A518JRZ5_9BACT|nr:hypothetical protein [Rosistilla carotiformis]QDV68308.1 hypothetical protein Poly24_20170 [Rosistilla carotiformis]